MQDRREATPPSTGWDGLRDILIAVLICALITCSWLVVSNGPAGGANPARKYYPFILVYAYLILVAPPLFGRKAWVSAISALSALALAVLLVADLTALRFFNTPILKIYPYLPVTVTNVSADALYGYATSYVPISVAVLAVATTLLGVSLSSLLHNRSLARTSIILLLPVCYLVASLAAPLSRPDPRISALMAEPKIALRRLANADRSGNFGLGDVPRSQPRTIILVIMESTGAATPSSDGERLLSQQIARISGTDRWINFPNAVTNSNATDISVPSILTGSAAHEPIEKVHALPFLSQQAAARGYRTAFVTSSTIRWGGFDTFLANAGLDEIITGDDAGLPFINDLAVDDYFAYTAAADLLEKNDSNLFLTVYPQAFHWPFQTRSAFGVPEQIKGRRERAAFITESGFRLLFEALRKAGRMDDTLLLITGDHGELEESSTLRMPRIRLDTFEDGVLSPIFLMRVPASVPSRGFETLTANTSRLVANQDIAPTFADLLGVKLMNGLAYDGYSLFTDVPADRFVYSTSTNDWRHWPTATIAVSRGRERMTCDQFGLCRLSTADGANLKFSRPARPDDELFRVATREPVLRRALGQIFRRHHD